MKIKKPEKRYPLHQSPLYKLSNKRKLALLFGLTLKELDALLSRTDNYRVFKIKQDDCRLRQVEVPKPILARIHKRIFILLSRINPPSYLHSGVKGRSYITNAKAHCGYSSLFKLDITKFYPSTKGWHVFEFFHEVMKCSSDVAGLLTKICVFEDHVPTGSHLSQILAFYSHLAMFNELNDLAQASKLTMTCYVDDISFSGDSVTPRFRYIANKALRKRALISKGEKEKVFYGNRPRIVTGIVVTIDGLRLANKQHHKLKSGIEKLAGALKGSEEWNSTYAQVRGRLVSSSQVKPQIIHRLSGLAVKHADVQR